MKPWTAFKLTLTLATLVLLPRMSWAYYSTMDTGDLIEQGHYRLGVETQFVTSGDNGFNLVGRFDTGLNEDSNLRAVLGFGATDFQAGFYYKWIPFPDFENQPAIGALLGIHLARFDRVNDIALRAHPLLSKKFDTEMGEVTPYASLPLGLHSIDGDLEFPVNLAVGAQWKSSDLDNFRFLAELGFNLHKSASYFSLNIYLNIDPDKGLMLE